MEPLRLKRFFFFFFLTLVTTTMAGAEWMFGHSFFIGPDSLGWAHFWQGLQFSLPFLAILTCHEFGHYVTARLYKAMVSLPLYIPLYLSFLGIPTIGTAGAFIRIYSRLESRQQTFDVGIAGPWAGFIVALGVLWYGFTHLPPPEHIFSIHPDYARYGLDYAQHVYKDVPVMALGDNLLTLWFKNYVCPTPERIPNAYELMHYPWLFAGYLALLVTALNLLPIGQLDGGHTLLGLFGQKWHSRISPVLFTAFVLYAGWGMPNVISWTYDPELSDKLLGNLIYLGILAVAFSRISPSRNTIIALVLGVFTLQYAAAFYMPQVQGYQGWLLFSLILGRFLGIYHPPVEDDRPMNLPRIILGVLTLAIFVLCFTPVPLQITNP